jgi:hypothetical protein
MPAAGGSSPQERVRLGVIGAIRGLYTAANVVGYRDTYPTTLDRRRFASAFGDNVALRLFYGLPHDLATVAGYVEFRVVGITTVLVAVWAVFAAVRALRGEEDAATRSATMRTRSARATSAPPSPWARRRPGGPVRHGGGGGPGRGGRRRGRGRLCGLLAPRPPVRSGCVRTYVR